MYQQFRNKEGSLVENIIQRIADNAFIPFDPANTDYQAYLLWCSEGNAPIGADTPLPADEV